MFSLIRRCFPGLFLLLLAAKGFSGEIQTPLQQDQLPEIVSDGFVLFEENGTDPSIIVHSGDIALRQEDFLVALGSYPVPKSFETDLKSTSGGNWSYYRDLFQFILGPMAYTRGGLAVMLHEALFGDIKGELGAATSQESVPEDLRITPKKFTDEMMGNFKPVHLDLFEENSPEARAHAKIKDFKSNFYRYSMLSQRNKLDDLLHYYPGTSFVSHVGIFSVEMENGKPHLYIYDSYPHDDAYPDFPGGLEKMTPTQFFDDNVASYGVIMRPTEGTVEDHANAAKAAWTLFHKQAYERKGTEDLFDGIADWHQVDTFSCSSFVWHAYIEGAHLNVLSDLNMLLIPKWVIKDVGKVVKAVSNNLIAANLEIAPQSFVLSTKTERVVDFDSSKFDRALTAVSKGEPALPLPFRNERNPDTGHPYWSTENF